MIKRWLLYLVALCGCVIFLAAYQGWVSRLVLLAVAIAPWVSLVLSLPFMLLTKAKMILPGRVKAGSAERLQLEVHTPLLQLPQRCSFRLRHNLTGSNAPCKEEAFLPTRHCGQIACTCRSFYVYDFLGLFCLSRRPKPQNVLVFPAPIPMPRPEDLEQRLSRSWRPKYGGGFAEQHELRLFRPGDSLNQVHWKLTAKTGKLTVREPMVPDVGLVVLSVCLHGDPMILDRKLGRLLWMGQYLLSLDLKFEVCAQTGNGLLQLPITDEQTLDDALAQILGSAPAQEDRIHDLAASWQLHIGGEPDAS